MDEALKMQKPYLAELNKYFKNNLVFYGIFLSDNQKHFLMDYTKVRQNTYLYNQDKDFSKIDGFFPDFHPNKLGYKVIAEDIFNYLQVNKLIPCD